MNRARREGVTSAWLGFALSALFFYPLASTLDSSIYFLHWQRRDMVETLLALAILASAFGLAVHAISRRPGRGATVGLCFVAALPLTSFVAGVSRQLPVFAASLQSAWESPAIRFGVPAVVALLIVTAFIRRPDALGRWVRGLLAVLSPVSFVVLGSVIGSAAHPAVTRVSHEPSHFSGATAGAKARCASVLALLFDELSFTYLYDYDGAAVRAEYPVHPQPFGRRDHLHQCHRTGSRHPDLHARVSRWRRGLAIQDGADGTDRGSWNIFRRDRA